LFANAGLAGEIIERGGPEGRFKLTFVFERRRRYGAVRGHANFTLAHGGKGGTEERLELCRRASFEHFAQRLLGGGTRAAKILQS
jgi:hypothetical protein